MEEIKKKSGRPKKYANSAFLLGIGEIREYDNKESIRVSAWRFAKSQGYKFVSWVDRETDKLNILRTK